MRRYGMPFAAALLLATPPLVPIAGQDAPVLPVKRLPARPGAGPATPAGAQLSDDAALKAAGLTATDADALLAYLKARTLSDDDQSKIGEVIARFGTDEFDARVRATDEVEKFGSAAIGPLKAAVQSPDPEVAYRARLALKRMEKVPHSAVASAAVRTLAKLKPKAAAEVMLGFLPMADTDEVAEDIRAALIALAVTGAGAPEPALLKALDDKLVVRRSAAYVALTEGGPAAERIRIKEAFPLVKAAVRKEPDTDAKFRGLWALLLTTREKEFVPDLIGLIPQLSRGRIWQLEEFLLLAAGDTRPDAKFGKSQESLAKARDAWAGWWKQRAHAFDLAGFEFNPRITGFTDVIEYDGSFGRYRVVTLGPDEKEKARLGAVGVNQLSFPTDVKKLPNGNYLIAELNMNRVTERDSTSRIVKTTNITQPLAVEPLPDGGVVYVCRNQILVRDKDGKPVWQFTRGQHDIMGGCRLPNGDIAFVTMWTGANNQTNLFRLAGKDGKEVGKPLSLARAQQQQGMNPAGDDRVLVCEYNRVAEYDLKTGKEVWKYDLNNATCAQRLPNGHTLITYLATLQGQPGKVIEVDTSGDIVWDYSPKDNMRPSRALRR
ncbi:PQQ-binding-like beta-propeller repeat protein [Gemmata sp. JC717]|uniref:outer membrane protein assembly factor BamB family protein n=1 Tax=Gemmata algarum TaxID=2975278 RepID=UPI0021BB5AA7|nr:PQQ-binding-like beta-propeller repeat protein [Gemmata algarum]MDY3551754.1 PQQ-binding-like beta-propeller repeat protein [Gemmata algarum]